MVKLLKLILLYKVLFYHLVLNPFSDELLLIPSLVPAEPPTTF